MSKANTASQMRKLVRLYQESGQSQRAFSALHGLKQGKLQYWISKLSKPSPSCSRSATSKKDFVSIALAPEHEGRSIMIRCASGVEIEIPL